MPPRESQAGASSDDSGDSPTGDLSAHAGRSEQPHHRQSAPSPPPGNAEAARGSLDWAKLLHERHRHDLLLVAFRTLTSFTRAHAQDIVSAVITDVAAGVFARFPSTEWEVLAFTKAVTRNRATDANRRESRMASLPDGTPSNRNSPDPWRNAEHALLTRDVTKALDHLTPRERDLTILHWLEGWRVPELAAELGIAESTVKELLRRARRKLRPLLAHLEGT